jgi:hypothetical protein
MITDTLDFLTPTSRKRIETFIDWFIRDQDVCPDFGSTSDDRINDPERYTRCEEAASDGADGSTHREVIDTWRENFYYFMRNRPRACWRENSVLEAAVEAYFDGVENWHTTNGTIDEQIG